ncbi:SCO7613 C-terminal domain-containing membrane protein [Antribacter gilvus]|uniref:SCO7613 C-terminal domain-containing membrane protein n=1 Tax=Antribacter gilvus TaxID=2304675 RepID=UPI000F7BA490|nr:hypothetical protein [Antribacter gilvus]
MREPWVDVALARLPDTAGCPACGAHLTSSTCGQCRLDLSGPVAHEIARTSREAAAALVKRQQVLEALRAQQPAAAGWARSGPGLAWSIKAQNVATRLRRAMDQMVGPAEAAGGPGAMRPAPMRPVQTRSGGAAPAATAARPAGGGAVTPGSGPAAPTRSAVGLQPILAGAGAGLLAVAAVVFVFFTLADQLALRAVVTTGVTVGAVAVAALMRRAGLRSSGEAVAALAVVLTWVDVELALQAGLMSALDPALTRGILLAVVVAALGLLGHRLRVRAWATAALLAAPLVPVLLAAGLSGVLLPLPTWTTAFVATALVAYGAGRAAVRVGARLGAPMRPESAVLRWVRAAGFPAALVVVASTPLQVEAVGVLTPLTASAIAWAAVGAAAAATGHVARVRSWVSAGVLALPLTPALVAGALAADLPFGWVMGSGLFLVSVATAAVRLLVRTSGARVQSDLAPERTLLALVRGLAFALALACGFVVGSVGSLPGMSGPAVFFGLSALVAGLLWRTTGERAWAFVGGAVAAVGGGLLGAVPEESTVGWFPLGAGAVWLLLAVVVVAVLRVRAPRARAAGDLLLGAWSVAAVAALPAVALHIVLGFEFLESVMGGMPGWTPHGGPLGGDGARISSAEVWAHLGHATLVVVALLAARLAVPGSLTSIARAVAPWATLTLVLALALDGHLLALTSVVLLALLTTLLLAATADPARSAPWLRGVVGLVQRGLRALAGATVLARRLGGHAMTAREARFWRVAAVALAFLALYLTMVSSWSWRVTGIVGGAVVAGLLLAARASVPRPAHPWLVGGAYAYALWVLMQWLGWLGLEGVAIACTVSAAASLGALVVTQWGRVERGEWLAVLGVTSVPFVIGVVTVASERTWWSAGAAAAMLALELVLMLTTRTGLVPAVRVWAAALVLPTASVVVVSAGAMLLETSGSPVVLPVIATLVAVTAGVAPRVAEHVAAKVPVTTTLAPRLRWVLEASAVVTGLITVALAYARPAAGPDIAVAVLLLLAAGAGVVSREPDRRRATWLSALLVTAAVWTALADAGVRLVEAYTLPPALGAIVVGGLLARRAAKSSADEAARQSPGAVAGTSWRLARVGLALALVPSLVVHLVDPVAGSARPFILVGAGVVLLLAVALLRWRPLVDAAWTRAATLSLLPAVALTGVAGTIEALHVADSPVLLLGTAVLLPGGAFAVGLAWSVAAAGLAAAAARLARPLAGSRWSGVLARWGLAPALLLGVVGAVANVRESWGAIIVLWVVEVALLVLLVAGVRRLLAHRDDLRAMGGTGAPPWFVWACALAVAIAAWSPRELRVEVFSVPLGVGLALAGYLAARATAADHGLEQGTHQGTDQAVDGSGDLAAAVGQRGLWTWPLGRTGSWALLAPGLLALLGPSVLATYTDPLTWRAVLVIGVALTAVLVGSRARLAAPFLVGVWLLPIEILVVFLTQLGTQISAVPWMLTLAAAGGVLLIIATLDERRTAGYGGAAAYLRDLR